MNFPRPDPDPIPPHLSMDDYADWISRTTKEISPETIQRQKDMEERITERFRFLDEQLSAQ